MAHRVEVVFEHTCHKKRTCLDGVYGWCYSLNNSQKRVRVFASSRKTCADNQTSSKSKVTLEQKIAAMLGAISIQGGKNA